MTFALRPMAEDENFRDLYDDPHSPVAKVIAALQADVNNESTPIEQLSIKRARLNGMRAVRDVVLKAHEAQIIADKEALAHQEEVKANRSQRSMPWLRAYKPMRIGNFLGRLGTR